MMQLARLSLLLFISVCGSADSFQLSPTKTVAKPTETKWKPNLFRSASPAKATAAADGEWTEKRLHNTGTFRSIALLASLGVAGGFKTSPLVLSAPASSAIHVLAFSSWFGTVMYTTFILGITMFKNLPRQTFGKLQAKLFPKYFSLSSILLVLQLVTAKKLSVFGTKSVYALAIALVMTLANQFYLEPVSTSVMMQRYEMDNDKQTDSDEYKALRSKFGKLHGMSSMTNLIAVCAGVVHAILLSRALVGAL